MEREFPKDQHSRSVCWKKPVKGIRTQWTLWCFCRVKCKAGCERRWDWRERKSTVRKPGFGSVEGKQFVPFVYFASLMNIWAQNHPISLISSLLWNTQLSCISLFLMVFKIFCYSCHSKFPFITMHNQSLISQELIIQLDVTPECCFSPSSQVFLFAILLYSSDQEDEQNRLH